MPAIVGAIIAVCSLLEKLIPFASKFVDAYVAERQAKQLEADERAKNARNQAAIDFANKKP